MTNTASDLSKGIHETEQAIRRAEAFIEKLRTAGANRPAIWAALADSTMRLRDHLIDEIQSLEAALSAELKRHE